MEFEHRFFSSFEESQFRLDENEGVPVYAFVLGQQEVSLPFSGIKREFNLPEFAADAVMLNTVEHALRFINVLQNGDPIPPEVLTGDASWEPNSMHIQAARNRLSAKLVGWNLDQEVPLTDPVALEKFVEQFVTDETVRYALLRLSAEFDQGTEGASLLSATMKEATSEFAYIEALRERYLAVRRVGDRLRRLRREFAHLASVVADVDPVSRLISIPIRSLGQSLVEVDARMGDIVSLFRNFSFHRNSIREIRDDMYSRLAPWNEITESWSQLGGKVSDPYEVTPLLRDLYRFLAPRYMPADNWSLMLSRDNSLDESRKYGKVVTWYERDSDVA